MRRLNSDPADPGAFLNLGDCWDLPGRLWDLAQEMGVTLEAKELPPLEIPRRDPFKLVSVLLDTRSGFTHAFRSAPQRQDHPHGLQVDEVVGGVDAE